MKKGLTIVELVIVISIIAVLASIAGYNILSGKTSSNEITAVTHLRQIALLQNEIRLRGLVDQDADSIGEFALLGELCGTVPIRSLGQKEQALSNLYGPKSGMKYGEKDGYCFQIFLPAAASGTVVTDNGTNTPTPVSANANNQENRFRCYAWPIKAGKTGNKAFGIDQVGNVYSTPNLQSGKPLYTGSTKTPAYNAASSSSDTSEFIYDLQEGTGGDGLTWTQVK